MAVIKRNPTSPGRRFQTVSDFSEITRSRPEKSLLAPRPSKAGRNSHGRITSRHRGGGHKRRYRVIDFRRTKDGVPAKVAAIEYDPNRNARIALLHYVDGEKRYILAPVGVGVGTGSVPDQRPRFARVTPWPSATSRLEPPFMRWRSDPVGAPKSPGRQDRPCNSCPRKGNGPAPASLRGDAHGSHGLPRHHRSGG